MSIEKLQKMADEATEDARKAFDAAEAAERRYGWFSSTTRHAYAKAAAADAYAAARHREVAKAHQAAQS